MRIAFFFSLLTMALLISCENEPGNGRAPGKTTPHGFEYKLHVQKDGKRPEPTNWVSVHMYGFYDDSLVYSTRKFGDEMIQMEIPDWDNLRPQDSLYGMPNPITDVLAYMGIGDSASVFVPIDTSMYMTDPNLKDKKKLHYDLVLYEVMTAEEYQNKFGGTQPQQLVVPENR